VNGDISIVAVPYSQPFFSAVIKRPFSRKCADVQISTLARVGHIDRGGSERERRRSQRVTWEIMENNRCQPVAVRHRRRFLRTTIAECVPRRCPAPLGLFDEISRCDRPRFPGLRSAAARAVESRPGWGFKKHKHQRSPFLAPKGDRFYSPMKGFTNTCRNGSWHLLRQRSDCFRFLELDRNAIELNVTIVYNKLITLT
jgi:hypothetical protein